MKPVVVRNVAIGEAIPKICVPIVGKTIDEILNQAKHICEIGADVVEWRVDWFEEVNHYESVENAAKQLRDILGETPILFTFRTAKEGGERAIEPDEYVELNEKIAKSGYVDLVDVEAFIGDTYVEKVVKTSHECGVKVIASNHDFRNVKPSGKYPVEYFYAAGAQNAGSWRRHSKDCGDAAEHRRCSDTFVCYGRNETMLCRPPGYYNVYGRNRDSKPHVWGSLWLSTYIWCGGKSICTRTD